MHNRRKISKLITTLILGLAINISLLAGAKPAHAQKWGKYFRRLEDVSIPTLAGSTFGTIISALLPYLFVTAGLILLLYLIYGGYQLMLSRGDPKAIEAGKGKITAALTGFFIIFISYWLVQIIGRILGIEVIKNIFG